MLTTLEYLFFVCLYLVFSFVEFGVALERKPTGSETLGVVVGSGRNL